MPPSEISIAMPSPDKALDTSVAGRLVPPVPPDSSLAFVEAPADEQLQDQLERLTSAAEGLLTFFKGHEKDLVAPGAARPRARAPTQDLSPPTRAVAQLERPGSLDFGGSWAMNLPAVRVASGQLGPEGPPSVQPVISGQASVGRMDVDDQLEVRQIKQKERMPKYKKLPEVEVALKVRALADLDHSKNIFSADIGVQLDWLDPCLVLNKHYVQDLHTLKPEIFPQVLDHVFNPEVYIDNAITGRDLRPEPGSDDQPRVVREVSGGGLWMTKYLRFHGSFACHETTYHMFPFDIHRLPVTLESLAWTDSSGKGGRPKLTNPWLVRSVDNKCGPGDDRVTKRHAQTRGHAVDAARIHIGELEYFGWGRRIYKEPPPLDGSFEATKLRDHSYELLLLVRRQWQLHLFTICMLIIMIIVALISFCCSLNDSVLSNRLSITLTVLLSLIAFTKERPNAIQYVPYNTSHDVFAHFCIVLVGIMSLLNVVVIKVCFRVDPGEECSLCLDIHNELCQRENRPGIKRFAPGATRLDNYMGYIILGILFGALAVQAFRLNWKRQSLLQDWELLCGKGTQRTHEDPTAPRAGAAELTGATHAAAAELPGESKSFGDRTEGRWAWKRSNDRSDSSVEVHRSSPLFHIADQASSFRKSRRGSVSRLRNKAQKAMDDVTDLRRLPSIARHAALLRRPDGALVVHVLDLGGGEVGYYRYTRDASGTTSIFRTKKEKLPMGDINEAILGQRDDADDVLRENARKLSEFFWAALTGEDRSRASHVQSSSSASTLRKSAWARGSQESGAGLGHVKIAPLFVGITGQLQNNLSDKTVQDSEMQMRAVRLWKLLAELPMEPIEQSVILFSKLGPSPGADSGHVRPGSSGGTVSGRARGSHDLSRPQPCWRVRPFLVQAEQLPSMERRAIEYLLDFGDLRLSEIFAQQPVLSKYFQQQVKSWVLQNSAGTMIDKLDFLELFFPLAGNPDTDVAIEIAEEWYNEMAGVPNPPCVDFETLVVYITRKERLLQAIIRRRLFIGSISGGVGSFQLTLAIRMNENARSCADDNSEIERHSAPCGSKSPMTGDGLPSEQGMYGQPIFQKGKRVTTGQLSEWQAHLRRIITGSDPTRSFDSSHGGEGSWPRQRRGVFVGIAGMFFAADAAGIAARFISRTDALDSFDRVLAEELNGAEPKDIAKHQQTVANVAIYREVVSHVLHDDAWLYVQREWRLPDAQSTGAAYGRDDASTNAVATWSLGWFLMGSSPDQVDETAGAQPNIDRKGGLSRLMTSLYHEPNRAEMVQSGCQSWCCGSGCVDHICRGCVRRCRRRRQSSYTQQADAG